MIIIVLHFSPRECVENGKAAEILNDVTDALALTFVFVGAVVIFCRIEVSDLTKTCQFRRIALYQKHLVVYSGGWWRCIQRVEKVH